MPLPNQPQIEVMFKHMLGSLKNRESLGVPTLSFELSNAFVAATVESASIQQDDAEISNVKVMLNDNSAEFSASVKVKGRAWPPRPPVNTDVGFKARDIRCEDKGASGSIIFTIEKPLEFSSKFVDLFAGLIGKLLKGLPVSLDDLRRENAQITLDFADMVRTWEPEMSAHVKNVRLFGIVVSANKARFEIGFQ